jgi:hypothetical protein
MGVVFMTAITLFSLSAWLKLHVVSFCTRTGTVPVWHEQPPVSGLGVVHLGPRTVAG